jgi:hypothetical protein
MALSVKQRDRLANLTPGQLSCLGLQRHEFGRHIPGHALPPNWHARMVDGTPQVTMTCTIGCGRSKWYWAPGGLIDWSDPHYSGNGDPDHPFLADPDQHMERWMYRAELDKRNADPLLTAAKASEAAERLARRREPVGRAIEDIEARFRKAGDVISRHGASA